MEPLLRRLACWCVFLLGVVVVVLTGTFALDEDVSACWSSWLALAEGEALDLCDVHGQQRAAFVGRSQELRF